MLQEKKQRWSNKEEIYIGPVCTIWISGMILLVFLH